MMMPWQFGPNPYAVLPCLYMHSASMAAPAGPTSEKPPPLRITTFTPFVRTPRWPAARMRGDRHMDQVDLRRDVEDRTVRLDAPDLVRPGVYRIDFPLKPNSTRFLMMLFPTLSSFAEAPITATDLGLNNASAWRFLQRELNSSRTCQKKGPARGMSAQGLIADIISKALGRTSPIVVIGIIEGGLRCSQDCLPIGHELFLAEIAFQAPWGGRTKKAAGLTSARGSSIRMIIRSACRHTHSRDVIIAVIRAAPHLTDRLLSSYPFPWHHNCARFPLVMSRHILLPSSWTTVEFAHIIGVDGSLWQNEYRTPKYGNRRSLVENS